MVLTGPEQRVCAEIDARREELVRFTSDPVGFDTAARNPGGPPRDEAAFQAYLANGPAEAGAAKEPFGPDPAAFEGKPRYLPGLGFERRPQPVARFAGAGGGRSLLLNGHIDAASAEPRERWTTDPVAAEVLSALGVRLGGDLTVASNTDEESSGAGEPRAGAARRPGRRRHRRVSGLDCWYDGATFSRLGAAPAIAYGPPGFTPDGPSVAHTIGEHGPLDGLVGCAKGLAVAAMRFCGVAA